MSWQAMDAVDRIPYDVCTPIAYRVLVKLANVAAQDGSRAWRSNWEMADELGVSTRTIQRGLRELETLHLIRLGDQKFVSHIRADRRPRVYDVVMHHHLDGTPLLDGVTDGVTEISTPPVESGYGVTDGVTTAVAHRELSELTNSSTKSNHRGLGCDAVSSRRHKRDAEGYCVHCGEREQVLA